MKKLLLFILLGIGLNSLAQSPVINNISPSVGSIGTLVALSGSNLDNPISVVIGGKNAIVISNTSTKLVAMVMPGATTGGISLTTAAGAVSGSFTVIPSQMPNTQHSNKLLGTGAIGDAQQGSSVSVSADGNTAIVGGSGDDSNNGAAWVYTRSDGNWSQQTKLIGTGAIGVSYQGRSVSLSADGNTAMLGGYADNDYQGAAWIFTRNGSNWTQQAKLVGTGNIGNAFQGTSVSLSANGNTAILGGTADNTSNGAAWIFTRSGSSWTQQAKLVGTGNIGNSYQGSSVSLSADGNTAMSGGYADDNFKGGAWIFTRSGSSWAEQTKLVGTGNIGDSYQGRSVSLSADGNTAMAGGFGDNAYMGAAWVYSRSGSTWTEQIKLVATDVVGTAWQGTSVSLSADGNSAIVGGRTSDGSVGAAWLYSRSNGSWIPQGNKLVGTGAIGLAQQGSSVALSANGITAILGGLADNAYKGAAWVFTLSNDARLSSLALSTGTLSPVFASATNSYTVSVPSASSTINLTPTSTNALASISVNGTTVVNRQRSGDFALNYGSNTITIIVTAQDRTTTQTYTVTVTREKSTQTINPIAGQSKTYGDAAFEPGATATSGLLVSYASADNSIAEPYQDTADGNKWKINIKKAGTAEITASQAGDVDYQAATAVKFSLIINKKPVNISLSATPAISKVYDGNTNATIAAANLIFGSGEVISGDQLSIALSSNTASYTDATVGSNKAVTVPLANMSLAGTAKDNYSIANATDVTANVGEINKKPVNISLSATPTISKAYDGNTNASIAVANLIFGSGEVISGDQLSVALSSTTASYADATVASNKAVTVPLVNMSLSGAEMANYSIANLTDVTANVGEITKAPITGVSLSNGNFTYDGTAKSLAITGILPAGATVNYVGNNQTEVGSYTVTANITGGANYADQTLTASLIIEKLDITGISFAGANFVYDGTAKSLAITGTLPAGATVSYTGNGQTASGTYTVTANINGGTSYTDQTLTATLTISKAPVTAISLADANFVYDGTAKSLIIAGALPAGVTVNYTNNGQRNAGTYTVTANINGGANYQDQSLTANLNIAKAILTITANNASMCQGSNLPSFTANYAGFKNGDTESSLTSRPNLSTTANSSSAVGTYSIIAAGAAANNYEISYVNGALSITALPVITITSNKGNSISKGETITLTASGGTSYAWTGEGIISGQNSATLTIRPRISGTYKVRVSNGNGCSSEQSFELTVREDFAALQATNIMSPNGDGVNDNWVVANIDMYPNNQVKIFDQAGRLLYSKRGYDNSWNGMVNGTPLSQGTYYYIIDFGNGKIQKGFITLLR